MTTTRPDPMRTAVSEDELVRSLRDLIAVFADVPEGERAGWFRSMERFARANRDTGLPYNIAKLCGVWIRGASVVWPRWPESET